MIDQGDAVNVDEAVIVGLTGVPEARNLGGRPSKITSDLMQRIFFLARKGLTDAEIGYVVGVSESSMTRWKRSPTFRQMLDEAKAEPNSKVESSLFMLATPQKVREHQVRQIRSPNNTQPDRVEEVFIERHLAPEFSAVRMWLERLMPQKWGPLQAPLIQQNVAVVGSLNMQREELVRRFRAHFGEDADRIARKLAIALGIPIEMASDGHEPKTTEAE